MNTVRDIPDAAEILKKYGYYHITEDFLSALIHYANLMDQTGMFTEEEEYRSMSGMSFRERVCANIHQLSAVLYPSVRQFHRNILKGRTASVREYTDMGTVNRMSDPGAQGLGIIDIQNDDLILTYEGNMMCICL